MWWAVTALTTVGYGDVYPITPMGRALGSVVAFIGVGFFALPAGIISSGFQEVVKARKAQANRNIETPEAKVLEQVAQVEAKLDALRSEVRGLSQLRTDVHTLFEGQQRILRLLEQQSDS